LDQLRLNLKALETLQKAQQSGVNFFEVLKDEKFVIHLLVDIYCNALRRAEQNRFEDALLRFYRLIELVSQHRLAKMNIDTSSPNQLKLNEIEQKFKEVTKQLHGKEKEIPNQIALMDGHIILFSFGDEIWKDKNIKDLMTFLECIKSRDYSIVAHGITLVDRQLYQKFLNNTKELLVKLCNLYNQKFDYLTQQHTPLRLS
jgi:CRISPR-associated protein (TIGR02710 family)